MSTPDLRTEQIFVAWLGPSMNSIWSGGHWSQRSYCSKDAHTAVALAVQAAGVVPFDEPVSLTFQAVHATGRRRLDLINYALSCKAIEDGLVEVGVLPGDAFHQVSKISTLSPIRDSELAESGMCVWIEATEISPSQSHKPYCGPPMRQLKPPFHYHGRAGASI